MKSLRPLIPYLKNYRRAMGWGLLWLAATNALGLLIPWMLKTGVDAVPSGRYRAIALFAAILAAAALLRGAVRIASRLRFLHTARRIEVDLRRDLLERLLAQDAPFFDRPPHRGHPLALHQRPVQRPDDGRFRRHDPAQRRPGLPLHPGAAADSLALPDGGGPHPLPPDAAGGQAAQPLTSAPLDLGPGGPRQGQRSGGGGGFGAGGGAGGWPGAGPRPALRRAQRRLPGAQPRPGPAALPGPSGHDPGGAPRHVARPLLRRRPGGRRQPFSGGPGGLQRLPGAADLAHPAPWLGPHPDAALRGEHGPPGNLSRPPPAQTPPDPCRGGTRGAPGGGVSRTRLRLRERWPFCGTCVSGSPPGAWWG